MCVVPGAVGALLRHGAEHDLCSGRWRPLHPFSPVDTMHTSYFLWCSAFFMIKYPRIIKIKCKHIWNILFVVHWCPMSGSLGSLNPLCCFSHGEPSHPCGQRSSEENFRPVGGKTDHRIDIECYLACFHISVDDKLSRTVWLRDKAFIWLLAESVNLSLTARSYHRLPHGWC